MGYAPPLPPLRSEMEIYLEQSERHAEYGAMKLIERINSLERINRLRVLGLEWGQELTNHNRRFVDVPGLG